MTVLLEERKYYSLKVTLHTQEYIPRWTGSTVEWIPDHFPDPTGCIDINHTELHMDERVVFTPLNGCILVEIYGLTLTSPLIPVGYLVDHPVLSIGPKSPWSDSGQLIKFIPKGHLDSMQGRLTFTTIHPYTPPPVSHPEIPTPRSRDSSGKHTHTFIMLILVLIIIIGGGLYILFEM